MGALIEANRVGIRSSADKTICNLYDNRESSDINDLVFKSDRMNKLPFFAVYFSNHHKLKSKLDEIFCSLCDVLQTPILLHIR